MNQLVLTGRAVARARGLSHRLHNFLGKLKIISFAKTSTKTSIISKDKYKDLCLNDAKDSHKSKIKCIKIQGLIVKDPTGRVLVNSLSLNIEKAVNVLIKGPNGSGKSTVLRYLTSLRQPNDSNSTSNNKDNDGQSNSEGSISIIQENGSEKFRLALNDIFYLPQNPYMTSGNLIDQIIYPLSLESVIRDYPGNKQEAKNSLLIKIIALLEKVDMKPFVHMADFQYNEEVDWNKCLSGGEKQKLSFARLFYHHPDFALLDECTSAISSDKTELFYNYCIEEGITLVSVSHQMNVFKYHQVYEHFSFKII